MLDIDPQWQGRGLGRRMLARMIGHWPAAVEIRLEVLKANAKAIGFYERMEFQRFGETEHATGLWDVPSIYMDRVLVAASPTDKTLHPA